jgi:blocked-early-in-transport protein 1
MSSRYAQGKNRTALFDAPQRVASPYDKPPNTDVSASKLASMESQSEEEAGQMAQKIAQLKTLGLRMGDEIRSSNVTLDNINDQFDQLRVTMKNTWNRMLVMAQRSGIPLKVWAGFFSVLALLFFYVWIT